MDGGVDVVVVTLLLGGVDEFGSTGFDYVYYFIIIFSKVKCSFHISNDNDFYFSTIY